MRRFLALIVIFIFTVMLTPFTFLYGVQQTFLREKNVKETLVPASYDLVVEISAREFARTEEDKALFEDRIQQGISKEQYERLLGTAVTTIFEVLRTQSKEGEMIIDLQPIRNDFEKIAPEIIAGFPQCQRNEDFESQFRFCKPSGIEDEKFEAAASDILAKNVPPRFVIQSAEFPEVVLAMQSVFKVEKIFTLAIVIQTLFGMVLVALLIWKPWHSVLFWCGIPLISVGLFSAMLAHLFGKIPQRAEFFSEMTLTQKHAVDFVVEQMRAGQMQIALWYLGVGVMVIAVGFALKANFNQNNHA